MVAVLALQLAFIGSYLGAFHRPEPHRIPIAVVYPGPAAAIVQNLNDLDGKPLSAQAVDDEATARRQIEHREVYGALIMSGSVAADRLLVASAAGTSAAQALTQVVTRVEQARRHDL